MCIHVFYVACSDMLNLVPFLSEYHGFSGEVPVSFPTYHTLASDVFLQAGEEIGYKQGDYNGENQNCRWRLGTYIGKEYTWRKPDLSLLTA